MKEIHIGSFLVVGEKRGFWAIYSTFDYNKRFVTHRKNKWKAIKEATLLDTVYKEGYQQARDTYDVENSWR